MHLGPQVGQGRHSSRLQPRVTADHHTARYAQRHTVQGTVHQGPQPVQAGCEGRGELQQLPVGVCGDRLLLPEEAAYVTGGQHLQGQKYKEGQAASQEQGAWCKCVCVLCVS